MALNMYSRTTAIDVQRVSSQPSSARHNVAAAAPDKNASILLATSAAPTSSAIVRIEDSASRMIVLLGRDAFACASRV